MTRFNGSSPPKGKPAILPPPQPLTQIRARQATAAPKGWLLSPFIQQRLSRSARCVLYYNTTLARETLRSPVASRWQKNRSPVYC